MIAILDFLAGLLLTDWKRIRRLKWNRNSQV